MREDVTIKKTTLWQAITAVLGILLIISIFTKGFIGCPTEDDEDSVVVSEGEFSAVFLNDKRCMECSIPELIPQLKSVFPGLEVEELDYSSSEGRSIYEGAGLTALPAILFTESIKTAGNYNQIEMYLEPKGDYLSLRLGAEFDPEAEICDNGVDDTGNGIIDCDDESCMNKFICNKDVLVDCAEPYGIEPDSVVYYYSDGCGFCNMMKPSLEKLEGEGYNFYWADTANADDMKIVGECFSDYISSPGSTPQFLCMKSGVVYGGAFIGMDNQVDEGALKRFADDCVAS